MGKEIIFQSDNASCFASQQLIPFVYHFSVQSSADGSPQITRWIFTETKTDQGYLNTHFSYLIIIRKAFVEEGNNITLEEHILDALLCRGGIAGMRGALPDMANLPNAAMYKKVKSSKIGSRAAQDIL